MNAMQAARQKIYNFLRWSEKYTKTDMIYLARGGFWLATGQIVTSFSALLISIAFANLLPADSYGSYRYILSVAGILALFTLGGMNTSITRSAAMNQDGSLKVGVRAKALAGVLGLLVGCTIGIYYLLKGNSEFGVGFIIVGLFVPFFSSSYAYEAFLQGKKLYRVQTQYFLITNLAASAVMICTLLLTDRLFLILIAYFLPWTLLRYFFYRHTLKKWVTNEERSPETLPFGIHLTAMNLLQIIAAQIDKILIFQVIGPVQVAIYSFALALPEQIQSVFRKLAILAFPKYVEKDIESIHRGLRNKMWRASLVAFGVMSVYLIVCPFIFKLFFPLYLDSIFYSQVAAIGILGSLSFIPLAVMEAKKKTSSLYFFNIATAGLQIVLMVTGILLYGIIGAILAKVTSRLLNLALSFTLLDRHKSS